MNNDFDRLFFYLTSIPSYITCIENEVSLSFFSGDDDRPSDPSAIVSEGWIDFFLNLDTI